jgi:hypothetical protein
MGKKLIVCKKFHEGKCKLGVKCPFYHPMQITRSIQKECTRKRGHCYCGAVHKTIPNYRRKYDDEPYFYTVCARTGKSTRKCM